MTESIDYDLFISYAEADRAWVEGYLIDALTQAGVKCFSEAAFRLGVPRIQEFQRAIQQSRRTLLVISPAYFADDFSQFVELLGASYGQDTQTWPVIPLVLKSSPLPPRLAMLVRLNATTSEEQENAIARLCDDLQHSVSPSPPKPPCPYPGMVPFSEKDQERFFGRDEEIEELSERLRTFPFITVIGPSGSGKSSLVFAGLVPKLKQSGLFGAGEWLVLSMRPGSTPFQTLQSLIGNDLSDPSQAVEAVLLTERKAQRLLLIVDQFEELFTQPGQELEPFLQRILKLIDVPKCYIVLTVRADFYPDLMTSSLWQRIQTSRMEVIPLNETGLKQAIEKPAEKVDVFIEPSLVERLVDDSAGEPGILPLIQETLVLLWERVERRFLPLRAYEALVLPREAYGGLSKGHRTGLQVAIARRADAALASLTIEPDKQYRIARRIFIRLVQFGEGRADTRRQQLLSELQATSDEPSLFDQTLEQLINCRLLTSDKDEKNPTLKKVDIAHEALISGWPTLQSWIAEHRETEQTRRRLTEKAKEWESLDKTDRGLLDKFELDTATHWLASVDAINLSYEQLLGDFVEASKKAVHRQKTKQRVINISLSLLGFMVLFFSNLTYQKQREAENLNVILELQNGNLSSGRIDTLVSILEGLLDDAKKAQSNGEEKRAIDYSRTILDIIFRIDTANLTLNTDDIKINETQKTKKYSSDSTEPHTKDRGFESLQMSLIERYSELKVIQKKASMIMENQILKYGSAKIERELKSGNIGTIKLRTTYLDYKNKFKRDSAFKATYDVIMIDLGADINRVGTLSPKETERIPCSLLLDIDELWRKYTDNKCGWLSSSEPLKGANCITDNDATLSALIFPQMSYEFIQIRHKNCKVKYFEKIDTDNAGNL